MTTITTWFLKECPKCGGDLYLDPLLSGDTVKCLQCGLEVKLSFLYIGGKSATQANLEAKAVEEVAAVKEEPATKKRRKATSLSRL